MARKPKAPAPGPFGLTDPHVLRGLEYARQVTEAELPACKWVRLACLRQLKDLERAQRDQAWRFRFDEAKAGRAARFLEQLPHSKGPKAGELLQLEAWQCFVITTVYGWVRKDTGTRRFRRAYLEVPRGNGKSFMGSGNALYGLAADGESGADVYSAATTTEQAKIVWGDAELMLKKRPAIAARMGIRVSAHAISQPASSSTFKALSREAKSQDGKNIHMAIVDELHAHRTREVWDVLITGAAKRPQSLIWVITTAGVDTSGICYEVRDSVVKMLEGAENEHLFGIVYTIDPDDDWKSEESWIKANPNWNASIDHDTFRLAATEAMQTAAKENNFKTKHLNLWCNAAVAWMQMAAWDACGDPTLKDDNFGGSPCILGLDLATKIDLVAKAKLFWRDIPQGVTDGGEPDLERHYYLFLQFYLPEEAIDGARNAQYEGWAKDGWIRSTPGNVIDFEVIRDEVVADANRHQVSEVAFDPWQAQQLANELAAKALTMVEVRPTVQNFSEPMKALEALVLERRLHHDANPVMRWNVSNVVALRDAKDNIYPRKERYENKIDGPVAAIMGLSRAVVAPAPPPPSYLAAGPAVVLG